jgi:hypothetical protein
MSVSSIYVPPRYRVRFNANFKPAQPVQVEIDLLPSGVFGIQDGRTPRRAEPATVRFDQKTGEMSLLDKPGGDPIVLDPVSLRDLSIGLGQQVSMAGSRITWTESGQPTAARQQAIIEGRVHFLLGVLPLLGYRRRAPISVSKVFVKQDEEVVGWAELVHLNLVLRPYDRTAMEDELRALEARAGSTELDVARWWALVYYGRALRFGDAPFLDDSYAEVITNFWKAAEAILGTWKVKEVNARARRLGLGDSVAEELMWLCELRHSDDVAHAVLYRKKSLEQLKKLYADRHDKVRRAANVMRVVIDHVLPSAADSPDALVEPPRPSDLTP